MATTYALATSGIRLTPGYVSGGTDRSWGISFDRSEANFRITISGGLLPTLTFGYYDSAADSIGITVNGTLTPFTTSALNVLTQQVVGATLADGTYDVKIKRVSGSGNFMLSTGSFLILTAGTGVISNSPGFGAGLNFGAVAQATGAAGTTYLLFTRQTAWTAKNDFNGVLTGFQTTTDAASVFTQDNCIRFWADFGNLGLNVYANSGSSGNETGVALSYSDGTSAFTFVGAVTKATSQLEFTNFSTTSGRKLYELNFSGASIEFLSIEWDSSTSGVDTTATVAIPANDLVGYMDSITEGDVNKHESATSHGYQIALALGPSWRYINLGKAGMTVSAGASGSFPGGSPNALTTTTNIGRLTSLSRTPNLILTMPCCANDHFDGSSNADVTTYVSTYSTSVFTAFPTTKILFGNMLMGGTYNNGTGDTNLRNAFETGVLDAQSTYGETDIGYIDLSQYPLGVDADWSDGTAGGVTGGGTGVHPSALGVQIYLPSILAAVKSILATPTIISSAVCTGDRNSPLVQAVVSSDISGTIRQGDFALNGNAFLVSGTVIDPTDISILYPSGLVNPSSALDFTVTGSNILIDSNGDQITPGDYSCTNQLVPVKVLGLHKTAQTSNSLSLAWTANSSLDKVSSETIKYVISPNPGGGGPITQTATTVTINGIGSGVYPTISVKAVNSNGTGTPATIPSIPTPSGYTQYGTYKIVSPISVFSANSGLTIAQ